MSDAAHLSLWTEADGSTHFTVILGAGEHGSADCSRYPDRTPIMSVWRPGVGVTIASENAGRVTDAEMQFARDLAATAAAYLAACEHIHAHGIDNTQDDHQAGSAA